MTAATEVDLEAWMQEGIEEQCTAKILKTDSRCELPAQWLAAIKCSEHGVRPKFLCDRHVYAASHRLGRCRWCKQRLAATWIERIKR